jgi:hypothetical protein
VRWGLFGLGVVIALQCCQEKLFPVVVVSSWVSTAVLRSSSRAVTVLRGHVLVPRVQKAFY